MGAKPGTRNNNNAWKKGQSGNPNGRPPMPPELKAFKKLSPSLVHATVNKFCNMTLPELEAYLKSGKAIVIERMVGEVMAAAARGGDQTRLNFILDRVIGKVRDEMHHTADIGDDTPKVIIMLPANGREVNMPAEPK